MNEHLHRLKNDLLWFLTYSVSRVYRWLVDMLLADDDEWAKFMLPGEWVIVTDEELAARQGHALDAEYDTDDEFDEDGLA